jgi:hypothetical protein
VAEPLTPQMPITVLIRRSGPSRDRIRFVNGAEMRTDDGLLLIEADEGLLWIHGHHDHNSAEVRALQAAHALVYR